MVNMLLSAAVLLSAALLCSGARVPLQSASAPAPSSSPPNADLLFIISANKATFTAESSLVLNGVSESAQFTTTGGRSGIYPTSFFTNTASGSQFVNSSGQWLAEPQAVLFGKDQSGNQTAALITLGQPQYDNVTQTLTFPYQQLPATTTSLKFAGGAVGDIVVESENNMGTPLVSQIAAGTSMTASALFIDSNQQALAPKAETKFFFWPLWGGYGGYGGCGYGCGYGDGYGDGYGYRHGYGGYGYGK